MNRIDKKFRELKKKNKKAFIPFVMAGDPDLSVTEKLIFEFEKQGASIIELGVPFSDPLADGPTIQRSSERALKNKISLESVFGLTKNIRSKTGIPVVLLIYYNLVHHYGVSKFVKKAKSCGVDGVVIPDLPPEESFDLRRVSKKENFSTIHLMAPTSSVKRMKMISLVSTGFIYYVSLTGTTGTRRELPKDIQRDIKKAKAIAKKPLCVGFGISTPEQARMISKISDGVIVGSAIIKIIEQNIGKKDLIRKVGNFTKKLTKSI